MLLSPWNRKNQLSVTEEADNNRLISIPLGGGERREGKPHDLSPADRDELHRIFIIDDNVGKNDAQFDHFCSVLELAIGFFKAHQEIPKSRIKRGKNRRTLKQLNETASKLQHQLDQLPPGALRELDLALQALSHSDGQFLDPNRSVTSEGKTVFTASMMHPTSFGTSALLEAHRALLARIASAVEFAQEHRRTDAGGRSLNVAEILLAQSVARAFDLLDERPTTSERGCYEQVLRLALSAGGLRGTEDRDLHGLVQKALQGMKPT
jgi:hypothetical protein